MKIIRNTGFDNRRFLTEAEWQTYCRRKPVRYIRKQRGLTCWVCGQAATAANPFQNAHIISFDLGVIELALTPDFLDSDANIVTAHRIACNKATELDLCAAMEYLGKIGVQELPTFLPGHIHQTWQLVVRSVGDKS